MSKLFIIGLISLSLFAQCPVQPWLCKGKRFDWYVDSVNGNDSNSGRTQGSALQTISALMAKDIKDGHRIGLKRGSAWREEIELSTSLRIEIAAYGTGTLPLLDASDVVTAGAMTQNGTYPVVYQAAWTPPLGDKAGNSPDSHPSIWENNVLLKRVASLALVNSTAGSFYSSNSHTPGTPQTVYFQATDSSDPRSNGKTYESSVRKYGLRLGNYAKVANIHARRSASASGSIAVGRFSVVDSVLAESGNIHNLFIGSGVVKDSVAWKADPYITITGSVGIMFIGYHSGSGSPKDSILFLRDKAVGAPGDQAIGGYSAFHTHGSTEAYGTVTYDGCEAYYTGGAYDADNADSVVVRNSLAYETRGFLNINPPTGTVSRSEFFTTAKWGTYCFGVSNSNSAHGTVVTVDNFIAQAPTGCIGIRTWNDANVSVTSSSFVIDSGSAIFVNANTYNAPSSLALNKVVFGGVALDYSSLFFVTGGIAEDTLTSNYNVFDNTTDGGYKAIIGYANNTYRPIGGYFTANPTKDANSSKNVVPGWVGDPTARDYRLTAGGAAGLLGAGADPTVAKTVDYNALVAILAAL